MPEAVGSPSSKLFFDLVYVFAITTAAVALGGPALYLLGNALYKQIMSGAWLASRAVAIATLAAGVPLALAGSVLVINLAATLVVVAVAEWETRAHRSFTLPTARG
jgi:low temperature requirement protein LtrA